MVEIIRKIILRKRLIRNYFLLLLLAALLCPAPGATAEKLSLPLLWTSNLKTLLESAPTVADINNDRRDEVVIAGRENPWMRIKLEYNLVYPGRNGPVTSRRWEAIRESIEDYRILAALQEFSEQKNQEKYSETVEKKIEHLLNISLPNLVDNGFQAVKLGLSGTVIDDVSSEAKMAAFRQEMIDCVKATVNSPQTGK